MCGILGRVSGFLQCVGFNKCVAVSAFLYPLRTQIERTRTLNIRFYGARCRHSRPQIDMLRLLLQHSSIWEELRIELTGDLVPYIADVREPFPALRRAWVQWNGAESQTDVDAVSCFTMAISLVDIGACSQYHFVPILPPMHRQLTRYDFDAPWSTHYELLKSLPCLREVRITCSFDDDESDDESMVHITLTHLQRLYVSHADPLDYLRAPSLVDLAVNGGPAHHWAHFLLQSSCSLRRLCIEGLPNVEAVSAMLPEFPSITELAIAIKGPDADLEHVVLAKLLSHLNSSTPILPHIVELGFAYYHGHDIYYPDYLDMLASRWNADGCALKAAELLIPDPYLDPDRASLARMEKLRQAGLEISLLEGGDAETRLNRWSHISSWD
ncbi:hypothetical protein C8R45DRAFT_944159 [Mycena sanguinolenta]|nr:hypothetical protein C8R45DRAFT_944159 [Mycena sanguinolenta]